MIFQGGVDHLSNKAPLPPPQTGHSLSSVTSDLSAIRAKMPGRREKVKRRSLRLRGLAATY